MKQWNKIFKQFGKAFFEPQEDMKRVLNLFKKHGVKRIMDLGCGSGRHVVYFAKNGFRVYGIDIAEEGIRLTKNWLKKEKLQADLKIGSVYKKLPYEDDFFDAVISTQVIHHEKIHNIRKAIQEIERVLKPNGLLFITVTKSKYKQRATKFKKISPRTYIPLDGREIGLPHYVYNRKLLKKDFKNFKIYDIWVDSGKHYCLLGELKNRF